MKETRVFYKNGAIYSNGVSDFNEEWRWRTNTCVTIILNMDLRKAELWNNRFLITTWDIQNVKWMVFLFFSSTFTFIYFYFKIFYFKTKRLDCTLMEGQSVELVQPDQIVLQKSKIWNQK